MFDEDAEAEGRAVFDARIGEVARQLTDRERTVLQMVARGLVTPEIADELGMSTETVKTHLHNAMMRLDARTRAHAVALAAAEGQIALVAEAAPPELSRN